VDLIGNEDFNNEDGDNEKLYHETTRNPTPDSARSYVMQGVPFTQGTVSSIPIGGSISPEGFLPFILLVVVVIATVVVTVVVVVAVGGIPFILKLSFMVIGFLYRIVFHYLLY
ncbi:hypothetical protein Tco_1238297, partial [Tanacetum coccineum]